MIGDDSELILPNKLSIFSYSPDYSEAFQVSDGVAHGAEMGIGYNSFRLVTLT